MKKWKKLRKNNNIISHNYERLKNVVLSLKKTNEGDNKRYPKDIENIEPLITELKVFKQ